MVERTVKLERLLDAIGKYALFDEDTGDIIGISDDAPVEDRRLIEERIAEIKEIENSADPIAK